jgi:hypothetical protein
MLRQVDEGIIISYISKHLLSKFRAKENLKMEIERRTTQRFEISLPVKLEWTSADGSLVVEEGRTENVSINAALVHLSRNLPQVGGTVQISVFEAKGTEVARLSANVLRIERNPARPLAALVFGDEAAKWRESVFENESLIQAFAAKPEDYEDYN